MKLKDFDEEAMGAKIGEIDITKRNAFKWSIVAIFGFVCVLVFANVLGFFGSAANVVRKEFTPAVALEKYEWFIDQSNIIEKMDADVTLFQGRVDKIDSEYAGYGPKPDWSLDVRVMHKFDMKGVMDDLVAVQSQRNTLATEYNAASEKFNWSVFNTRKDMPRRTIETK